MTERDDQLKTVAIVTGGGSGIGEALSRELASDGYCVVIADKDVDGAERVARDIVRRGECAQAQEVDVTDGSAVDELVSRTISDYGCVDVMCANAGVIGPTDLFSASHDDWSTVIDVNLKGTIYCCQAVAESMKERRSGRILVTASYNAFRSGVHVVPYRVSKSALVMYVRCLALALAPYSVTVNALCPGVTMTTMQKAYAETTARELGVTVEEYFDDRRDRIPMKRFTETDDVVALARFLISDGARIVTGQAIAADGGVLASS